MLVGHPPFEASESNVVSVIYQHLEKEPTPPTELNPEIPPGVEGVVLKALNKNPDDRYDTAEEMADALNAALGRRPSTISSPAAHLELGLPLPHRHSTVRLRRRRRLYATLGASLLLLALVLAVVVVPRLSAPPVVTPTILEGQTSGAAESAPTDDEIARAQARLGSDGFIAYITCNQTSQYHAAQAREIGDIARAVWLGVAHLRQRQQERRGDLADRARARGRRDRADRLPARHRGALRYAHVRAGRRKCRW